MNVKLLKSKMVLYGDNGVTLAAAIGISESRFSAKLNEKNGAEFNKPEMRTIIERYQLTPEEVTSIFFA